MGKEALLDAMYTAFFEDYASFIKPDYEKALAAGTRRERYLIMIRVITRYYLLNKDTFLFSLVQIHGNRDNYAMGSLLRSQGIDMKKLRDSGEPELYPSILQFVNVSLVFWAASFHRYVYKSDGVPPDDLVEETLALVEKRIGFGLGIAVETVDSLDYGVLEEEAARTVYVDTEDNKLLRAVAGAVAEAGPWKASMEMVAKRSGLSKSGLYAHFKNRQDMMGRLFITEFDRIAGYASAKAKMSEVPEEQLYLVIISVVEYLRSRPEILVAINWIKTRRLDLGAVELPPHLYRMITELPLEFFKTHGEEKDEIAQWILFLIINTLIWPNNEPNGAKPKPERKKRKCITKAQPVHPFSFDVSTVPNESIRILFRYISSGLEGLSI
jgi:AcrR family transcriptional regulator